MTLHLPLLALAAPLLLAAAPDSGPPPAPLRLVETISPQGVQDASPGAIVSTARIARPNSVILAGDIVLDGKGERRTLARGAVIAAGGATGVAGVPEAIFCEGARADSTPSDTRYCLFDADKDGTFDHAVLVGAKGAGRAPFAIPPVEYGLIEGRPLSDDAVVRLRYVGPLGAPDSIAFDLEAYAIGQMRAVPHARVFVNIARLPNYAAVGAAVVTVLAYDPKTRVATVRMDHDLAPGHILLPELSRGY